jgi:hypothetical protein
MFFSSSQRLLDIVILSTYYSSLSSLYALLLMCHPEQVTLPLSVQFTSSEQMIVAAENTCAICLCMHTRMRMANFYGKI